MKNLKEWQSLLSRQWVISVLISAIFTFLVWIAMATSVRKGLPLLDASNFEYFGYAMSKGDILYTQIFDHKGPMIFLINYIGYLIGGPFGVKLLYLASVFLFFNGCFYIFKLFVGTVSSIFVNTVMYFVFMRYYEGGWGLEGYMLPFIVYSLYILIRYLMTNEYRTIEIILVGFSFAFVFLTKANMIGLWIVFALYMLVSFLYQKKFAELGKLILHFIIGALLLVIPVSIYLWVNGAFYEMIYQSIILNFIYSKDAAMATMKEMMEWYLKESNSFYLNLCMIVSTFIFWKKNKKLAIVLNATFLVCLYLSIVSKREYLHYLIILIPLYVPYVAAILKPLEKYFPSTKALVYVSLVLVLFYGNLKEINQMRRQKYTDKATQEEVVANYIQERTEPTDRIYSHRMNGIIYMLSDRLSNSRFFFIPSLQDETPIIDMFKEGFSANLPKFIVYRAEFDNDRLTDKYIREEIAQKYQLVKTVGEMEIYQLIKN